MPCNVIFCYQSGASKQLAMVVEGESLVNDGTAIVFYNVFVQLATSEKGLTGRDKTLVTMVYIVGVNTDYSENDFCCCWNLSYII